jgi:PST family polysaccharide transporter
LIGVEQVAQWIPGPPRRDVEIGSLLRFGGMLTLNGVVAYVAYNFDKIHLECL